MAFVITVVLLGVSGGIIALYCSWHTRGTGGAGAGFCVVSALAIVQSWMVASEIARARRRSCNMRNARYRGAQAKFRAVSLVGLCAIATPVARFVRGHEVIEKVESHPEYRFRPTEGMSP